MKERPIEDPTRNGFNVLYRGRVIHFAPRHDVDGNHTGYYFACPNCAARKCGGLNAISTEPGGWGIKFDDRGRVTLEGSILCRTRINGTRECGWHVMVEGGVARDV